MHLNYDYYKLESLEGDIINFPKVCYFHIKEAVNREKNNLDNVIVITGSVGSGKSNLAKGLCGVHEEIFHKRPFTLDNTEFIVEKVMQKFNKADNATHAINFDEAVQGGTGRDGLSAIGQQLRKKMITKRFKKHFLTLCIDNPKELNDKIIERCIAWYHVFYIRTLDGRYNKGYFKVFSPRELYVVYDDLKNYRYRFIDQHPIYQNKYKIYRCSDYSKLWYSEDEYNDKKTEETSGTTQTEWEKMTPKQQQGMRKLLPKLIEKGYKQKEIAEMLEVPTRTVSDWLAASSQ